QWRRWNAAPFKRGFGEAILGGCGHVKSIEHGDLIEQRRGGVDVLRVLVRNLAVHEQSGAVCIRSSSGTHDRVGWLLFRLGQPVMAFHQGSVQSEGLEALLAIEQDALEVENDVFLHELTMNALRTTMRESPGSVLHLEHHDEANDGDSWWSSVRLPSTSWRRAARLEDIESLALSTEERRRAAPQPSSTVELQPGCIYLLDSPDPHPMIHLGVELAERGMPLLGMFGLPHAQTEITKRLPQPQSYALLSPQGDYEVLAERSAMDAVLNAFQWGNERSVLLIDGLDRLGNALGDAGMLDAFRSMCDGVRFNDHVALVTTDLELFETAVQRRLLADVTLLRTSDVEAWANDPDGLWDHPLLLAPDEEEEQWLAAQIEHQGAKVGAALRSEAVLEGGSYEPDEEERAEATQALADVVESWPASSPSVGLADTEEQPSDATVSIGTTPWRPVQEREVIQGRFVSQSPRAVEEVQPEPTPTRRTKPPRSNGSSSVAAATLRSPQRLPKRKATPSLPPVSEGLTPRRSSAVVRRAPHLPDWPARPSNAQSYRKENLDVFTEKQTHAAQKQAPIQRPLQATALKDQISSAPDLANLELPGERVPTTLNLPAAESSEPLSNSLRPVEVVERSARETSSKEQSSVNMDEVYRRWSTFDEPDSLDATALYNEHGEALERYKGGKE
ncbi:MAG: hypothetical protein ACPGGE_02030, partial [Poseidonia sp.]